MNHKKLVIMGVWVGLIIGFAAMAWDLPLQDVARPECKGVHWQELSDECKIAIDAPMDQSMSELLISALRGASYDNPHDILDGSHPSADFATVNGTPVYTIGDGEVVTARYRAGYGNAITVRHDRDGTVIFSNYSHLSVMNVRPGDRVEQGAKIGEVGRSGFTIGPYGYHLDFQITTAESPSHPYGFHDCKEGGYFTVVQEGLCKEKLEAYTIDPLEFFAIYAKKDIRPLAWRAQKSERTSELGAPSNGGVQNEPIQNEDTIVRETNKQDVIVAEALEQEEPLADTVVIVKRQEQSTVDSVVVRERVQEHAVAVEDKSSQGTIGLTPGFDVSWELLGNSTKVGQIMPVKFTITQDGEPVSGKLDDRIALSGGEGIQLLPGSFSRIYKGTKTVFVRASRAGSYRLDVRSGDVQLGQIVLSVQ